MRSIIKRILIAIGVLLFLFALARISTSTYENMTRESNTQASTAGNAGETHTPR